MKIEQTHIDGIKIAFEKMQTKDDLLQLMNGVKPLIYGEKTVPFQLKQLTWYANPKLAKNRYNQFAIKKKSGADRTINAPVVGLKAIQKVLNIILQSIYEPHKAAMGFVKDRSIVDNAKTHVGSKYVYNIDLKDFFPSVDQARVWKCLQLNPFNLSKKNDKTKVELITNDLRFGSALTKETNNNLEEEDILHIKYANIQLISGSFKINLRAGGNLFYKVNTDSVNVLNGKITVNMSKSNLLPIKEILINNNTEKKDLNDRDITYLIISFIKYHFQEKTLKNNRSNLANIIASLCCTEMEVERKNELGKWVLEKRNVLPQGAPTSPILTNVVCQRLDYLLSAAAKRFGLKYSRYADDITFSSMHNVYQKESDFIKELHRIISQQGFHIKESKTRLQKEGFRKEVTGLLVNDKVNVQKRFIKQLRVWLYYWENYGYQRAYGYFLQQYTTDKAHNSKGKPDMVNVIGGKLDYLKMVKGGENEMYLKLRERYNKLTSKYNLLETVINLWENEGIEKAMELYYLENSDLVNLVVDNESINDIILNDAIEFDEIL